MAALQPEYDPTSGALVATGRWDRLGVAASVACAVHCLVAPLLFLAVPTVAGFWAHPSSHALIALFVLPLAGTVLLRGYRVHGRAWIPAAATLGTLCVLVGCALPFIGSDPAPALAAAGSCASCCPQLVSEADGSSTLGWPPASIATVMGSGFLVAGHLGNLACCRYCDASGGADG